MAKTGRRMCDGQHPGSSSSTQYILVWHHLRVECLREKITNALSCLRSSLRPYHWYKKKNWLLSFMITSLFKNTTNDYSKRIIISTTKETVCQKCRKSFLSPKLQGQQEKRANKETHDHTEREKKINILRFDVCKSLKSKRLRNISKLWQCKLRDEWDHV